MTDDMMDLRALVEKAPDADLLREMISIAAERLMEMEVGAAPGAGYGERNPLRELLVGNLLAVRDEHVEVPQNAGLGIASSLTQAMAISDLAARLTDPVWSWSLHPL